MPRGIACTTLPAPAPRQRHGGDHQAAQQRQRPVQRQPGCCLVRASRRARRHVAVVCGSLLTLARLAPRSMSQTVKNMLEGAARSCAAPCGRMRGGGDFPPSRNTLFVAFASRARASRAHARARAAADTGLDQEVPLPNVSSKILAKVIEYCKYHVDADKTGEDGATAVKEEDSKSWDTEFVKVDQGTLFELILVRLGARLVPRAFALLGCSAAGAPPLSATPRRAGGQLPQHQAAAGLDVPDRGQHDQGCAATSPLRRRAVCRLQRISGGATARRAPAPPRDRVAARRARARRRPPPPLDWALGAFGSVRADASARARHVATQARLRRRSARRSTSRTTSRRCVAARRLRTMLCVCRE